MKNANFNLTPLVLASAAILGALTLSACAKKEAADNKAITQVAAKVGSEEISVYQINQVLNRADTKGANAEAMQIMGREALEKLIDQQLAIDQATEAKLHRSPEVVAQMEGARREILARAYFGQVTAALAKPTSEEAKKYFNEHPQLFSERKVFNVQELVIPPDVADTDALRGFASSGKPIEEVADWLKAKGIVLKGGSATRSAEQIPLDLLALVYGLKDGQSTVLETPQGVTFVHLTASQLAPVTQELALPRILQFLANQRAKEAITAKLQQLRSSTKIVYLGEFAQPPSKPVIDAASQSPVSTPPNRDALEKGVAGLK